METRLRVLEPGALGAVLPGVAMPTSPFLAGMVVRTGDGNRAVQRMLGDVLREAPEGLMVPPERAGGAALVFAP
jgi:hypothetical protein